MPKFTDKDIKKNSLMVSEEEKPCCMCKEPTVYIDYISEGRLCSSECMAELYRLVTENEK